MAWRFYRAAEIGLPQPAGLGPGLLGFIAGVEVGNWLHLGPAGMSRMPGHLLMMSEAPEYGSFSWKGAMQAAGRWD